MKKLVAGLTAMIMVMGLTVGVASAEKPAANGPLRGVDCELLDATLLAVAGNLGDLYDTYGDLVSSVMTDPDEFALLQGAIATVSSLLSEGAETILLGSPQQAVATVAKCGLTNESVALVKG